MTKMHAKLTPVGEDFVANRIEQLQGQRFKGPAWCAFKRALRAQNEVKILEAARKLPSVRVEFAEDKQRRLSGFRVCFDYWCFYEAERM